MLTITKNRVSMPRATWDELKKDVVFNDLIEIIEDRELLRDAKKNTEYFVEYDSYRKERLNKINV